MKLQPIDSRKVVDAVTAAMLTMISDDAMGPGTVLPSQAELTEQLRVSRASVREAVQRLVALGVVEVQRGKRMVVGDAVQGTRLATDVDTLESNLRQRALKEFVELRRILEPEIAALAAERASDEQLRQLEAILEEMRKVEGAGPALQLNFAFHRALWKAAGNRAASRVMKFLEEASAELYEHMYNRRAEQGYDLDESGQHRDIFLAARNRDSEGIRSLMRQHIQNTLQQEVVDTYGEPESCRPADQGEGRNV